MIAAIIVGIIVGFTLAIAPGPVSVTAAKTTLSNSKRSAYMLAYATASVDFLFALIATFAASAVSAIISKFAAQNPLLMGIVQVGIVVGFIVFGIYSIIKSKNLNTNTFQNQADTGNKYLSQLQTKGPFIFGLAIAFSNIANPTFLPSLTYISLQVQTLDFFTINTVNKLLYSLGFGLGNFLWIALLVNIISLNRHKMSAKFQQRIHQFAGITFISFGTILGYRLFQLVHWPDIVRLILAF